MAEKFASNDSDEIKGKRTWTIRKIDNDTIEQTKVAAGKSGMKIGAWVDQKLQLAAEAELSDKPCASSGLARELSQITDSLDDLSNRKLLDRLTKIESEYTQIIKGQHSILMAIQKIQEG